MFNQFIVSSAAASKCEKPDKETLAHFLANLQIVSVLASKKLKEQHPQATPENIQKSMIKRSDEITQKINALIQEKGCSSPEIQQVIKRFYVQAEWEPTK